MCIRDRYQRRVRGSSSRVMGVCASSTQAEEEEEHARMRDESRGVWGLWDRYQHREAVGVVIRDMSELNPECPEERLWSGLAFHPDGILIDSWDLSNRGLTRLPMTFGSVRVDGDLNLFCNQLSSLPETFGCVQVGGSLNLGLNQLTGLPNSFGNLWVGGDLDLSVNQLSALPGSFGGVRVRGDLDLHDNRLDALPKCPHVRWRVRSEVVSRSPK
eukprot:TRINITY_DN2788_c0_g1_i1.p2 TRINITY_DN2788_c0_g1~~TRINITY_DN2788_c0_g1_i1.p2  ORF type:complete len:215 (+),score=62.00 TRINITY_DN2788_c0_g1_i1:171-815(+)